MTDAFWKQIDYDYAADDKQHANNSRHIQFLAKKQPSYQSNKNNPYPRPNGINDTSRDGSHWDGKAPERDTISDDGNEARYQTRKTIR